MQFNVSIVCLGFCCCIVICCLKCTSKQTTKHRELAREEVAPYK